MNQEDLDAYRLLDTCKMTQRGGPNVVKVLLDEIDRLKLALFRIRKITFRQGILTSSEVRMVANTAIDAVLQYDEPAP